MELNEVIIAAIQTVISEEQAYTTYEEYNDVALITISPKNDLMRELDMDFERNLFIRIQLVDYAVSAKSREEKYKKFAESLKKVLYDPNLIEKVNNYQEIKSLKQIF